MEYLLLLVPPFLLLLSYKSNEKFRKFKHTGKIPVIAKAKHDTTLYLVLALTSTLVVLMILNNIY